MILMGVICILIGLLGIWLCIVLYRKAGTDLPYFKSEEYETQGDVCFIIGAVALLTGISFIIGNFII